jgi:hypothetical protein
MILLAILAGLVGAGGPKVEYASADDCQIIVAIGRSEAAWGPNGPNQPFVAEGPLADGTIYRQACDWRALGVGAAVTPSPGQVGARFAIEKPTYKQHGKVAEAAANFVVWAGPGSTPFLSVRYCKLRKESGDWRLLRCAQGPIT